MMMMMILRGNFKAHCLCGFCGARAYIRKSMFAEGAQHSREDVLSSGEGHAGNGVAEPLSLMHAFDEMSSVFGLFSFLT